MSHEHGNRQAAKLVTTKPSEKLDSEVAALTLQERLERFDPARHGGELMAVLPIGTEKIQTTESM
jgi:hypothetical protein